MTLQNETPAEIARRLNVSERTVYRWIEQHGLTAQDSEGSLRVSRADLDLFLTHRRPRRSRNAAAAPDAVEHLFDAAARVTRSEGPFGLTLEKLAAEAGVTVGTVTYHFASRQLLLEALVDRFCDSFEAAWARAEAAGASPAEAYHALSSAPEEDPRSLRAVLVLTASSPRIARRAQKRLAAWYRRLAREGETAVLRCLAADALWLFDVLGLSPLNTNDRSAMRL